MSASVILAIDQGTTNTKALLITGSGTLVARASRPMSVHYPRPGWAEQSAADIWNSVVGVVDELAGQAGEHPIAGLAISNQRESIVLWDTETGKPIGPCVIWQCRRSSERCAALRAAGHEPDVVERTGLGLDPLFPAAKLAWLLDNIPGARSRAERGELRAGTVDSWLVWKLTGGRHITDHSNASRTQLFNLKTLSWDSDLANLFDVPLSLLPQIMPSDSNFGTTAKGATALGAGLPVHAVLGDSHAALYGHGITGPGRIKVSCGTGSSLMMVTDRRVHSTNGLSSTIAWCRGDQALYALEGNITVSGHAAAFATRLLGLTDENALTDLAQTVSDSDGVCFVPALAGLGAPHWCDDARGLISGMSLGTKPAHVARAVLEAIALQIGDVFWAMESDLGAVLPNLSVDGGASRNNFLMQLLTDVVERPVLRGANPDVSAFGAARMAAEALGIWTTGDELNGTAECFSPRMESSERAAVINKWRAAVDHAVSRPPHARQ